MKKLLITISAMAGMIAFLPSTSFALTCGFGSDLGNGTCRGFITSTTTATFSVPSDWNNASNTIEVIGGGGGGNGGASGGGGGAYALTSNVTLSGTVGINVGTGGAATGGTGGDTFLCNSTSNCATIGGSAVVVGAKGAVAGTGGATSTSVGDIKNAGGNGGINGGSGGSGGGGAGGPFGAGANGGIYNGNGGGGGGGNGGGSNGSIGGNPNGGAGGNNSSGSGGGASGNNGINGGGGGGGAQSGSSTGTGGTGAEWDATHGSGGGGGGDGFGQTVAAGTGGLYGGGGGGGYTGSAGTDSAGAQGIIVITYTPSVGSKNIKDRSFVGPSTLYSGLVGWWTFDGEDTNWATGKTNDRSLNGNNGQLIGMSTTTSPVPGRMGQALSFNATGSYVAIGTGPSTVDSVSFWMEAATSTNEQILELSGTQTVSSSGGTLSANGFSSPTIYVDGTVSSAIDTKWHLVTITTASPFSASAMNIGKIGAGYFGGILDDVRVYSRVLSPTEITRLYNTTAGGAQDVSHIGPQNLNGGLVGWWTFDGEDTNWATGITNDRSGNGNNGQLIGMSTTTSALEGKIGQAFSFNGSNSSIAIPSISSVESVSFWAKPNSTTQSILDLNGTQTIDISAGTVRGNSWSSPTIYVDAVQTAAFPDTKWHFVTITTVTPFNATAMTIGKISSAFYSGRLDDVRLYDRVLSAREVLQFYNMDR